MLKVLLAAILAALVVLIVLLVGIARPDHGRLPPVAVSEGAAPPPSSFVIHNDPPPVAATVAPPAATASAATPTPAPAAPGSAAPSADTLGAVMQRLRSAKTDPPGAPSGASSAAPTAVPGTPTPATGTGPTPDDPVATPPPTIAPIPVPPPSRWTSVTGQGVQYRMGRAGDGYLISIDLGGGQAAEVRVLPAFGRLDQSAVNTRVDYLKQTILENFPPGSASYLFNRDGSVTRAR